jgi:hypothetical protein
LVKPVADYKDTGQTILGIREFDLSNMGEIVYGTL